MGRHARGTRRLRGDRGRGARGLHRSPGRRRGSGGVVGAQPRRVLRRDTGPPVRRPRERRSARGLLVVHAGGRGGRGLLRAPVRARVANRFPPPAGGDGAGRRRERLRQQQQHGHPGGDVRAPRPVRCGRCPRAAGRGGRTGPARAARVGHARAPVVPITASAAAAHPHRAGGGPGHPGARPQPARARRRRGADPADRERVDPHRPTGLRHVAAGGAAAGPRPRAGRGDHRDRAQVGRDAGSGLPVRAPARPRRHDDLRGRRGGRAAHGQIVYNYAARYERGTVVARDTVLVTTIAAVPVMVAAAALLA